MTRHVLYIVLVILIYVLSVPARDDRRSLKEPDDTLLTASFFPNSSPFSNSQNLSRLNRKKLSRKLEVVNMENYRQFQKKNESLIMMTKKILSQPDRHDILVFWQLGEQISLEKNQHIENASYIPFFIDHLSTDLGLDSMKLLKIETLYTLYPTVVSLSLDLSWEHYENLIDINDKTQRLYYQRIAVEKKWSPQDLKEKINQHFYEKR